MKLLLSILVVCAGTSLFAQHRPDIDTSVIRPNIVWITCEDMSPHLSCFGEKVIETPNLDALSEDGVRYTNVYAAAGVCAPSRNSIITAMYPISIGGDNMRNYMPGRNAAPVEGIPSSYSIMPPSYVKCFTEYLRRKNYYCTNNVKQDYQFEAPVTAWDESSNKAHWKNSPKGRPFFAVFNLVVTHESQLWVRDSLPLDVDTSKISVPPYYPNVPAVKLGIARQLSNVKEMDRQAGKLIQELKDAGLYDNTIIFFYSDHGDGLPYVKREVTVRGLHIPLIIKFPKQAYAGQTDNRLISAMDFGPTALSLAGVSVPQYMQGKAFLGAQQQPERAYVFAARDRMDEQLDRVRSIFDGRYQYLRNYMPEKPYYQNVAYRLQIPMMRTILAMRDAGTLNATQMRWFKTKPVEELYDTKNDPYQLHNLVGDASYAAKLKELKTAYDVWIKEVGDKHAIPELELRRQLWGNADEPPVTAKPVVTKTGDGYVIDCATQGASIGYIVEAKNGEVKTGSNWKLYRYENIHLELGDELMIKAQRIGYIASTLEFTKMEP